VVLSEERESKVMLAVWPNRVAGRICAIAIMALLASGFLLLGSRYLTWRQIQQNQRLSSEMEFLPPTGAISSTCTIISSVSRWSLSGGRKPDASWLLFQIPIRTGAETRLPPAHRIALHFSTAVCDQVLSEPIRAR
jgi:hypothetical protein